MLVNRNLTALTVNYINQIGMTGFEPAASCSQSRRATKLRYIPLYSSAFLGLVLTSHQSDRAFTKALRQSYHITSLMPNIFISSANTS